MQGSTNARKQSRPQLDVISYGRDGKKNARGRRKGTVKKSGPTNRLMSEQIRENRRRKRRRKVFIARFICVLLICMLLGTAVLLVCKIAFPKEETKQEDKQTFSQFAQSILQKGNDWTEEDIFARLEAQGISCTQDFLTVNEFSRPAEPLKKVKNIFVHYTANPGTSASQNRSYFENLGITQETSASAHFIIGYEGELVQCIPLDEIAYAVAGRNEDSISIECCYIDENGKYTEETYDTLVKFSALLLEKYGLESSDLRRHYDENGKLCPKYYAENEDEWEAFKSDVKKYQNTLE